MGGEVITKLLVLTAGLIAVGVCVSPLLGDPAVEQAEDENLLESDPLLNDRDADVLGDPSDTLGDPDDDLDGFDDDPLTDGPLDGEPLDGGPLDEEPLDEGVLDEEAVVVADPVIVGPAAEDPAETVVPFFITIPALVVALIFTVWTMVKPAAELGRPALIAGIVVLVCTLVAWGLYVTDVSEFAMTGRALAAWLCVGFTLLAAWLVVDVLSGPPEDDATPG